LQDAVGRAEPEGRGLRLGEVGDPPVRHHHRLGPAGRAGGIEKVGELVRIDRAFRRRIGLAGADLDAGQIGQRGRPLHPLPDDQQSQVRVLRLEGDALLRMLGVERHVDRARLEDAEQADQQLGGTLGQQADAHLGPGAEVAQPAGERVGAAVEIAPGHPSSRTDHRGSVRRGRGASREQLVEGERLHRPRGVVPLEQGLMALGGRDPGQIRLLEGHPGEERGEALQQTERRRGVQARAVEGQDQRQAPAGNGGERDRVVGALVGPHVGNREAAIARTRDGGVVHRIVLDDHQALEQRCAARHLAPRLHVGQRRPGVREPGGLALLDLAQPIAQGRLAIDPIDPIDPHTARQAVEEGADDRLDARDLLGPAGEGQAEQDILFRRP
jgi:hypothetical protein